MTTDATLLLQWHYLIFLLPLGTALLLLLLSSLRLGHHTGPGGHGHVAAHGHAAVHGHAAPHGAHAAGGHAGPAHGHATATAGGHAQPHGAAARPGGKAHPTANGTKENIITPAGLLLGLLGFGRAPAPMVLEAFCIAWGLCGFWANEFLVRTPTPSLLQMLPSLGIALGGGIVGSRLAAELLSRVLPKEESFAVSQQELFGLTGAIAFPVSEEAGRIHIYDSFGTLHDEMCRVPSGHPPIEKGHRAIVVDMDTQGRLIVEEIPDSVR
ncbi:MAG TPA: hypothetical protein VFA07_11090 [Chthonomonadaceae bacterium]|nr:hypothetical protein [Chthonomonadaceae bacterium]